MSLPFVVDALQAHPRIFVLAGDPGQARGLVLRDDLVRVLGGEGDDGLPARPQQERNVLGRKA